jgi:pseudouridine synthase
MALERLQKILASAGIASRRKAEELITSGRISVNGETVTTLGSKADLDSDDIRVDGTRIQGPQQHLYIMLYKPREVVTTVSDPEGRPTVMDLVRDIRERVFPIGRLDYNSEGLLLLTNDGDLMQQLTAPTSHVPKTYLVKVSGQPTEEELNKLRTGVKLPAEPSMTKGRGRRRPGEGRRSFAVTTLPAKVAIVREGDNPWYEITLTEGRNRQIRRMFEEVGHHVEKIKRVRYGPLTLNVEPGKWRILAPVEVSKLRASLKKPAEIRPPRAPEIEQREIRKLADRVIGKSKQSRPRREWTERPPKRDAAARPPRREFGDKGRDFRAERPRKEFGEKRESDNRRPPRKFPESRPPKKFGDRPTREKHFDRGPRQDRGPQREGGPRVEGAPRRDSGFQKPGGRFSKGPERPGGFRREGAPKREDGFSRNPRREGGPKREGSFSRGPGREGGPKREGSFSRGPRPESGPKREGGFSRGPRRESRPKRSGGFGKRPGGFGKGPRQGGGPRRGPKNPGE